jgi:hypothetical protein
MRAADWASALAGGSSAVASTVMVLYDLHSPWRAPLVLGFMLIGPGLPFVRLLRLRDRAAELLFAVALSLSLEGLLATSLVYLQLWSPTRALLILSGVALLGLSLQIVLNRRRMVLRRPKLKKEDVDAGSPRR